MIDLVPTDLAEVIGWRETAYADVGCQVVRYSILPRGLADPYLVRSDGVSIGYFGIWNEHFPGRVMEGYLMPEARGSRDAVIAAWIGAGATAVEAQSNLPESLGLAEHASDRLAVENLLFADTDVAGPSLPDGVLFRARRDGDAGPEGEWVLESEGRVIGAGGLLRHYNEPFVDLYMGVQEADRGRGFGSALIAGLRRICRAEGVVAAARCSPDNEASRRTLERGGMRMCGELVAGPIDLDRFGGG